ncbi:hypothetical protein DYI37_10345 [Fulvimarina endophytica]|uniref:Uncharacterized protein n=1 Tax=Fulvimarina endophytica TaxID=2293836 RepID=A0A371X2I6_9HYPH|nr:hypothetical protein DYI37_10345 [Fulvimarina endophytica]
MSIPDETSATSASERLKSSRIGQKSIVRLRVRMWSAGERAGILAQDKPAAVDAMGREVPDD